MVIIPCL